MRASLIDRRVGDAALSSQWHGHEQRQGAAPPRLRPSASPQPSPSASWGAATALFERDGVGERAGDARGTAMGMWKGHGQARCGRGSIGVSCLRELALITRFKTMEPRARV